MRNMHAISVAVGLLLMISAGACSSEPTPAAVPTVASVPTEAPAEVIESTLETAVDFKNDLEDFDPSNFDQPTQIDNPWFPLQPGTQFVYEGSNAITNARTSELAKIGEILSNLCGGDIEHVAQRAAGDFLHALLRQFVQAAQVQAQSAYSRSWYFVPFHWA